MALAPGGLIGLVVLLALVDQVLQGLLSGCRVSQVGEKRVNEVVHAGGALRGLGRQGPHDERVLGAVEDLGERVRGADGCKGVRAAKRLPGHHGQREDVGALVH